MRNSLFIGAAFIATSAVNAADPSLVISAGEHGDFSRIVLDGNDADVAIETAGRIIRLRNIDASADVDLAGITGGQKAHRIDSAQRPSSDVIELQMNCDCAVRTLRTPDGRVVIDIADQTDVMIAEKPASAPTQLAPTAPEKETPVLSDELTVAQARDRMVELLQQAADDGLIMLKDPSKPAQSATAPHANDKIVAHTATPSGESTAATATPVAEHASQGPAHAAITEATPTAPSRQCLADQALKIDGDDFEADPLIEIETLQTQMAEATGPDREAAAKKLANGFLAIGFGEEATAVLKDIHEPDGAIAEIALVVAEQPLDADGVLLGAADCGGAHALWQAVATDGPNAAAQFKRSGDAIDMLPTRLKSLVLGRLAVKMVDIEAWSAAQKLVEIADKDGLGQTAELKYVRIRLADHDVNDDASRDSLLEVATENSAAADDALLALAESYAKQGGDPHAGFIEDIGALAKVGGSSRAAFYEAYSWAEAGNVNAALLLLRNEAPKSPENAEMASATASAIISRALSGDDSLLKVSALEAFLKHEDWIDPSGVKRSLRADAADFALEVGLPNLSYELLSTVRTEPNRDLYKKMAEAALTAGDAGAAIKYAAPYATESDFGAIIADAKMRQQDYHAALATAATISDEHERARLKSRAGWLSRNWQAARDGFRNVDPNEFDDAAAIQFGLSAYMSGETALPNAVDAALSTQASAIKAGLQSLFTNTFEGTKLEQARSITAATKNELTAFEEILSDG